MFVHQALHLRKNRKLVFTAFSKHTFYYRMFISQYVLEQGAVPLNPFMLFDYWLGDLVDHEHVIEANNTCVARADELWVFGPISNGVLAEIKIARELHKIVRYFVINHSHSIIEITAQEMVMEQEVETFKDQL